MASAMLPAERNEVDLEIKIVEVNLHNGATYETPTKDLSLAKVETLRESYRFYRVLENLESRLHSLGGIELEGINRIPDEERKPPSTWNMSFLWFSMIISIASFPTGMLGPQFGLTLWSSIGATVVGTVLGAAMTAYTAALCPMLGLRQIAAARYTFGYHGAKFCSVMNIIVGVGFGVVNLVLVGQVLNAVSGYKIPTAAGIIIISGVGYAISVFGFRVVHTMEKYLWILMTIITIILYAEAGPHFDAPLPIADSGATLSGDWLSYFAITWSNSAGWASMGGDYYVHYPSNTSRWKIFWLVTIGISIPTIFTVAAGNALGTAAISYDRYSEAYGAHGFGALMLQAWRPLGFAKAISVLSIFSTLGDNVGILYSCGLDFQLLGSYFHAVPRFVWSFVVTVIMLAFGIAGRSHLSDLISNFVSILGYWVAPFVVCLFIEDRFFRRRRGYDLSAWNDSSKLPPGIAAVLTVLVGFCAGGVPGMDQTWYVGPIARLIGNYGGDVGMILAFVEAAFVYPVARSIELKAFGR